MKNIIRFFLVLFIGLSHTAQAAQPIDELKGPVNEMLTILHDPQYKNEDQKTRQTKDLKPVVNKIFDFLEIAKQALARNWKTFSLKEKKEFSDAFAELLRNIYLKKVQSKFANDKVAFLNQDMVSKNKAFVKTKIISETVVIPIDYSMKLKNGVWKAYDVKVEGISLIKNYRSQFKKILLNKSPGYLIDLVKKQVERSKRRPK